MLGSWMVTFGDIHVFELYKYSLFPAGIMTRLHETLFLFSPSKSGSPAPLAFFVANKSKDTSSQDRFVLSTRLREDEWSSFLGSMQVPTREVSPIE